MFYSDLTIEFENYLSRQFIETVYMTDPSTVSEYVTGIIKKIIFEDIPMNYPVDNPEIMYEIVRIVADQPGLYLHYENLANDLKLSAKTISKYISVLEQAFVIKVLYNYSANQLTSEKKMKRLYLSSSSFCTALSGTNDMGRIVENALLSLEPFKFFWRDPYNHEVDFIDTTAPSVVPTEVKYKTILNGSDYNNLWLFCKKFDLTKAVMILKTPVTVFLEHKGLTIETKSLYAVMARKDN